MQLGEITEPKIDQSGPPLSGDFTYVDIGSVDNEAKRIVEPKVMPVASAPSRARQRLRTGDVLVSMTRPNLNAVALVPPELDGAIGSTGFHVLRASQHVLPKWLYYGAQTRQFVGEMSDLVQGALYPAVRPKDIRAFDLPVPMLDEQRRIIAEIEKQFSRLDEAVANLKRVKANLKRYKAAVLAAAVKGRIGARGVASDDDLPISWQWSSVGELATVGTGATPARSNEAFYRDGTIPWITSSAVNEPFVEAADQFVTDEALRQTNLTLYPPGTLLVAMYGEGKTRGKCSELRIAATTNQALAALHADPAVRSWLKLFLEQNYENTRRVASGGVQPNLNLGLIRSIKLPLPPLSEQHRIVAEVDWRLSILRAFVTEVDATLARAQALRTATLTRAFAQPPECHYPRGLDG